MIGVVLVEARCPRKEGARNAGRAMRDECSIFVQEIARRAQRWIDHERRTGTESSTAWQLSTKAFFGQSYFVCDLEVDQIRERKSFLEYKPCRFVKIVVWFWMIRNVIGRRKSRRIACYALRIWILVYSHVVEAHRGRHGFPETRKIQLCEAAGHAEVHDHCHRLLRDGSLAGIAVWSNGPMIHLPRLFLTNVPSDFTFFAGLVLKRISLVGLALVPVVIQHGESGYGLLKRASTIGVHAGDCRVVDLAVLYAPLAYWELVVMKILLTIIWVIPDIKGGNLTTLRDLPNHVLRIEVCHTTFEGIDLRRRS